jgi:putative CocE/NonD family hydrolase
LKGNCKATKFREDRFLRAKLVFKNERRHTMYFKQKRLSFAFRSLLVVLLVLTNIIASEVKAQNDNQYTYPMHVMQDEGKFTYYVNEEFVGVSDSKWNEDGSFENKSILKIGGQEIKGSMKIKVDENGHWTSVTMDTPRGLVEIGRSGASVEIRLGEEVNPLNLKPRTFVMEDMSPALMSQAVVAYDHQKGGEQEFPLFFIPTMVIDASIEYIETFERFVDDRYQEFRKYLFKMPPIYNVYVIVDGQNKVCLAEYPALHGVFIREGYDALNVRDASDSLLSQPDYEVIEDRNVGVHMRDGIELATDIYRPDKEGENPVILVRTPYKKEMGEWQARFYARRGYVFAIQDVRGRFSSPGEWKPFVNEAKDGYDTIEWLATQPWSNGKVGMIGGSYLGWAQWWAASQHPPHLVTIIPNVAPPEPYFNFPYEYGAFFLSAALWWADIVEQEATADLSGMAFIESAEMLESEKLKHLPVVELDEILLGKKNDYWREWLAHPDYDEYWRDLGFLESMKEVDIPVYHQSGWFDSDGIGSKLNYKGMTKHGHKYQKLVLGPWGHTDTDSRFDQAGRDWGPNAVIDLQTSYLRWMDHWLMGIENGIDKEPLVSLFVMGPNDWLHGNTYPLEGTKLTKFYLASKGDAHTHDGKGWLTTELPGQNGSTPDIYTYDPGDPTPVDPEGRKDILVYKTQPMTEPVTIAGPMSAVLYASSSAKDTDWILRLGKIHKEGNALLLGTGIIRARYRESFSEPKLLEPNKIYEYHLDMWHTGVTVDEGERLVLVVASALFPRFSRNLNTGGHNETETNYVSAKQTIYHEKDYPSHIVLPVIPNPVFGKK